MIRELKKTDIEQIAAIHVKSLVGDFLPSLGINFLRTLYSGVLGKEGVYAFGNKEKGKIVGFVVGTRDSNSFFRLALKSKFLELSFYLILQLIKNPLLIKNILETFLYTSKDKGPKAELVVIAVSEKMQGQGIGKKLIQSLEKAFNKDDIKEYKLTVHADKSAVQFYEHLKYKKLSAFELYGKLWYVYSRRILAYAEKRKKTSKKS